MIAIELAVCRALASSDWLAGPLLLLLLVVFLGTLLSLARAGTEAAELGLDAFLLELGIVAFLFLFCCLLALAVGLGAVFF